MISDFAVFSSILIMVLVDLAVGLKTPKLRVPLEFRVSVLVEFWASLIDLSLLRSG